MEQLFLIPACGKSAVSNVKKTLDTKINLVEKCEACGLDLCSLLIWSTVEDCSTVNVWGCQENNEQVWKSMRPGDKTLYYTSASGNGSIFTHYGTVEGKLHSKVLSKALWGDGEFEYIHFSNKLKRVELKKDLVFKSLGYKSDHVQRFNRVLEKRVINCLSEYGTIDHFVECMGMCMTTEMDVKTLSKEDLKKRIDAYDTLADQLKTGKLNIGYKPSVKPPEMKMKQMEITEDVNHKNPDYQEVQSARNKLGELGEQIAYRMEYNRLCKEGRSDLADEIKIVSTNNSYGYDILSYNKDGTKRFIEVKTTTSDSKTPFKITYRELGTADKWKNTEQYIIYRIYNLKPDPFEFEYYELKGNLRDKLSLRCLVYDAYVN